jgi:WXG100 family type VII secretion target
MSEIKVTFAALEAARGDVSGTAASISGRLDDLKRRLAPLAATWEGQAALEYQQRQRQWDASAADLTAVLAQIGVALGQAHDEYLATETLNAGRWRV